MLTSNKITAQNLSYYYEKSHFVFRIVLLTFQILAQSKKVTIHGIVKDTAIKSIEISYAADTGFYKRENKKWEVVNGVFSASLEIPFPTKLGIAYGNGQFEEKYIYNDVEMLIDTAGTVHITGSLLQDEYENQFLPFFQSNDRVYDSLISFYRKYGRDFPEIVKDSVNLLRETYGKQRTGLLAEYLKAHPDSYIALWDIKHFVFMHGAQKYFDFDKLFTLFSEQMQRESFITVLKERIELSNKMQVGQLFPKDFFKGYEQIQNRIKENCQYYLIDFWFSHCAFCIKEFPKLKEIYQQFHDKGFDIVSISIDEPEYEKDYLDAITKNGLLWNHVWDKSGVTTKKFNVNTYPTYILLDKNDKIINYGIKPGQLEAFLKEKL